MRAALPGARVAAIDDAGGSALHETARITTSEGELFAKWSASGPPDLYESEAAGLREMASAETGLVVPRVLSASTPRDGRPAFLLTEWLEPGPREMPDALGRGLATLHRKAAGEFGFAGPSYCGTTRQENDWIGSWPAFFAQRRLLPLLEAIAAMRGLSVTERRTYDRVLERLPALLGHSPVPSLIHGDLWFGNVFNSARGPALIDPACAYADREMEFGIATLFGGFASRFWSAYEEAWPLPTDWRERNPLYQLYHLLNHHLLFGGHYGGEALALARKYA